MNDTLNGRKARTGQSQLLGYTPDFYEVVESTAIDSARVVLGCLFDYYTPSSVLDFGCGTGSWLTVAEQLGSKTLVGVDGPWLDKSQLVSKNIRFHSVNLEERLTLPERFDLCISVEVAEHLSSGAAKATIETLCTASDIVLFSAAVRLQGGVNHINEQPQSYWASLFEAYGYDCLDLFRPKLWNDPRVARWYRQNLLLYVKPSHRKYETFRSAASIRGPLDIIHPEMFEDNLISLQRELDQPTLRTCTRLFRKWWRRQAGKLFKS